MGWKQELKLKDQLNFFLILEFCCKMFLYKFIHQAESACNEQHRQSCSYISVTNWSVEILWDLEYMEQWRRQLRWSSFPERLFHVKVSLSHTHS